MHVGASHDVTYFDGFGFECTSNEVKKFIDNRNITTNRTQACDSIMCGYFCTGGIDFILKGRSLLDFNNLFAPKKYEKCDRIIIKYFQ